jgi:hypothetical protein
MTGMNKDFGMVDLHTDEHVIALIEHGTLDSLVGILQASGNDTRKTINKYLGEAFYKAIDCAIAAEIDSPEYNEFVEKIRLLRDHNRDCAKYDQSYIATGALSVWECQHGMRKAVDSCHSKLFTVLFSEECDATKAIILASNKKESVSPLEKLASYLWDTAKTSIMREQASIITKIIDAEKARFLPKSDQYILRPLDLSMHC